ncbi:primosomal protein DnaT [Mixta intestinalis]|uniref:Replication restart protein DnaT n=1 Tax=Mixta intestinalis TaxID=1615494 RepID=A0A6P1Q2I3_9GAMM|nr:primosomal protein DnaT [Mixta intestinalis]QHM73190.1 Primosomal protein 1 [Mixta intestinalis]
MSVKILTSTVIGLEAFRQDPVAALSSAEAGAVAVFDNNAPVFYAVSPERLAQLLELEAAARLPRSDVTLDEQLYDESSAYSAALQIPAGKFMMYAGWRPDADFQRQAAIWGIALSEPVTPAELASFITWWQADGRPFHHVQWQQKLARSVQQSRAVSGNRATRDVNQLPEPDHTIPDGFRGE